MFSDSLIAGNPVYLRVSVDGIYRKDLGFSIANCMFYRDEDILGLYDWIVVPESSGYMYILVYYRKIKGKNIESIQTLDSFYVYPAINEILYD